MSSSPVPVRAAPLGRRDGAGPGPAASAGNGGKAAAAARGAPAEGSNETDAAEPSLLTPV